MATSFSNVRIESNSSPIDRFAADAVEAITAAVPGIGATKASNNQLNPDPVGLMRRSFSIQGISTADLSDAEVFEHGMQAAGSLNNPASFPNIMSQAAPVIFEKAAATAPTTFQSWAHRLPDADNLDPVSIGGGGVIDSLDDVVDGDNVKQKKLYEESKGWIEVTVSGNDIHFTQRTALDPIKFSTFLESTRDLARAGLMDLNRKFVEKIATNEMLIDGTALFHADHGNLIDSGGGPPSNTQLKAMARLHSAQRAPGASQNSGALPQIVFVPDALYIPTLEAFQTLLELGGMKVANVEQSQSYFKDRLQIVPDPMLDEYSEVEWYSMVSPTNSGLRSFVYRYLSGHGPSGKPIVYGNPRSRSIVIGVDFAAGAAVTKHRGVVKNPGA